MPEHGPFDQEQDALSTRAAARLKAVYDAAENKVGCTDAEALKLLLAPCTKHGIPMGDWDKRVLAGLVLQPNANVISIAALIERAYRAGLAACDPGDPLGFVVVTWNQVSHQPDIDTPGLHDDRETAELERDSLREQTRAIGRGERHEVCAVVQLGGEDEGDG